MSLYGQEVRWIQESMADISANLFVNKNIEKFLNCSNLKKKISFQNIVYRWGF